MYLKIFFCVNLNRGNGKKRENEEELHHSDGNKECSQCLGRDGRINIVLLAE